MGRAKRKRGEEFSASPLPIPPATGKTSTSTPAAAATPALLSSNWLQLRATFGKPTKRSRAQMPGKTSEALTLALTGGNVNKSDAAPVSLQPSSSDSSVTRILALDCEMVGVGSDGKRNALARVSLVNVLGNVVYDKHVRPPEFVTDFRTQVSGVRWVDLRRAEDFFTVQKEVSELLKGRILVGHALHNDLKVLLLSHPRKDIRDTQLYKPFRGDRGCPQALKHLVALHVGAKIQQQEHDSIEDARAALCLYQRVKEAWENDLKQARRRRNMPKSLRVPK